MQKTIHLLLPSGFRMIEETQTMHISKAEKILLSKRSRNYLKAVRNTDEAQLYAQHLVCPSCGKKHPANTNTFLCAASIDLHNSARIGKERIRQWASMQVSMFEDNACNELILAFPVRPPVLFKCRDCGYTAGASSSYRKTDITLHKKKITVRCEVVEVKELLSMELIKKGDVHISFPLFECVTFDLAKGRVYVRTETANGDVLSHHDITAYPALLCGGAFYKVFRDHKAVKRNMKRMFMQVWGTVLPFSERSLDLSAFFKMTIFVGYPASFYSCVPFAYGSHLVDKSFRSQAKKLHFAKNIDKVYNCSELPQVKSVRRIMFENPGLFFYAKEICGVGKVLNDHNLLCRFLRRRRVYEIVSALHMRPGMFAYLHDYSAVIGTKSLLMSFDRSWSHVYNCAVDYNCMSQSMRLQTQARWKAKQEQETNTQRLPAYSLPMCRPDEDIRDCTIDGYHFFWLRSSNDYVQAGEQLNNCLGEWGLRAAPVVCVQKNEKWMASIEVLQNQVVQAFGHDNQDIASDEQLYAAFLKWMSKYHLTWNDDCDLENDHAYRLRRFMDDDDLPF